jgi:hypothetical protein
MQVLKIGAIFVDKIVAMWRGTVQMSQRWADERFISGHWWAVLGLRSKCAVVPPERLGRQGVTAPEAVAASRQATKTSCMTGG